MGQTEQSEHIATGLKFIEAEVISLSNSQFYIILHHNMRLGTNETRLCPKVVLSTYVQLCSNGMIRSHLATLKINKQACKTF